jgi:hypothetical protein
MSLKTVKDIYCRFAEGDLEGFISLCAQDIEWVVNGRDELEKCRAFKGIWSGSQHPPSMSWGSQDLISKESPNTPANGASTTLVSPIARRRHGDVG